jgi:phosphonate transport system substrate-binding protein
MTGVIRFAVLALLAVVLPAAAQTADPEKLKVALLPDESPSTIIINNKSLKDYLERTLGKPIELVVTTDYSSMIEAIRFGRIDLGYFGPLSYVLARSKADIEPFAALVSGGSPTYTSVLIAHAGSGVDRLADAKGRTVGFGDPASTSSHLMPRTMLQQAGLVAGTDYKFQHLGTHDAVARAVQAGNVQVGGMSKPILDRLIEKGTIDPAKVRLLQESSPIPNYPWTMRAGLAPALKERIRHAFLDLKDPEVLKAFKGQGFAPVSDKDYDVLRELARILNLDLTKVSG